MMQTKITESSEDLFISEDESYRRWGTYDGCGNHELVTRTKWVKVWFFWLPYYSVTKKVRVDNLLGCYALGCTADFNPCFSKDFKI